MKKILILALAMVMSASVVYAQAGGEIGLFGDVGYSECNLAPDAPYTDYNVYIVHVLATEMNSSQFKLVTDLAGAPLNQGTISFSTNLTLGDLFAGITVTYVGCRTLPWLIATIPYFYYGTPGTEPACTYSMHIEADPGAETGQVEGVTCGGVKEVALGSSLTFWGSQDCPCGPIVKTQDSSWSKIKSLYR
jgi:hypothetical protein